MLTDVRPWLVLITCLLLEGCGTVYLAQAARGQVGVLNAREPISRVIEDPATPPELRARLESVRAAREFASRELGLPDNKSYTTYADLKRAYVTWSVVAAPEFSVEPREWCFPIAGCVAYRGYFNPASAEKFAAKLRARGYDTSVSGVPAYSTLGKFNDPVLNTMLAYGDDELAAILFHELAHQVVYLPDDSAFNEAFAVAVEREGLARWLKSRGRESDLSRHLQRRARQAEQMRIVVRHRAELAQLYASALPVEDMRARKAEAFTRLTDELRLLDARHGVRSALVDELEQGPNNALLASLATYFDCAPGFERLLAEVGHDLPRFYAAVRELAATAREQRRARLCAATR